MIFGRKRTLPDAKIESDPTDLPDDDNDEISDQEEPDQWIALDHSQDWRDDGPFDISEVDLSDDDVTRIDLGVLIVTPEKGMSIKLIAPADTDQIMFMVVDNGQKSAAQISVIAAPAMEDYCAQIRDDLITSSEDAESTELAIGPFGTELRRVMPIRDPQGQEVFLATRDWLIPGPRWVISVRLTGQAAQNVGKYDDEFIEFVRNLIVRRGHQAMMPGAIIALTPDKPKA